MNINTGFRSLMLLVLVLVVGVACSSSPGVTPTTIDGEYAVERWDFEGEVANTSIRIDVLDVQERLEVEVFGADSEFSIRYRFPDGWREGVPQDWRGRIPEGNAQIRGSISAQRNSVQFIIEAGEPANLLLPSESFTLRVQESGDLLTIETQRDADLRPYQDNQTNFQGTLRIVLRRQ